jgi:hypothetical protein
LSSKSISWYVTSSLVALSESYTIEFEWYPWIFGTAGKHFWTVHQNQRNYFDWVAYNLALETQEQWTQVTAETLKSLYGAGLIGNKYDGSIAAALQSVYPGI